MTYLFHLWSHDGSMRMKRFWTDISQREKDSNASHWGKWFPCASRYHN